MGLHFFGPVPLMGLVEVVKGAHSSDETVDLVVSLASKLGKEPVICRDTSYGFLANRNRKANLNFIRQLLKVPYQLRKITHSLQKMMRKITGIDITLCPCCKKGRMKPLAHIPRHRGKHPHSFIRPPNALATLIG